jgi:DNA replicative helicase MCM subunit Mcm2 (Cdc46/Mcm family)
MTTSQIKSIIKEHIAPKLINDIKNHHKPLTTLYLDYVDFPTELAMILLESNDFSLFSNDFCEEFKNCVAELDEPLYSKIRDLDLKLRISNFQYNSDSDDFIDLTKINELGAEYFKELLVVRGTVIMMTENRIKMKKTRFKCIGCDMETELDFNQSGSVSLEKCQCGEENSFKIVARETVTTNSQTLTIEELAIDSSKNPVSIDILIDGDIVNKFEVGDIIVVSGNLRFDVFNDAIIAQFKRKVTTQSYHYNMLSSFGGSNNGVDFDYIIEANYVRKITEKSIKFHDLSDDERQKIDKLKNNPHLIDILVQSFCPQIYGWFG